MYACEVRYEERRREFLRQLALYFSIAIVLLIFGIYAGLYYTHQIPMSTLADDRMLDTLFNADALFFPALYKDLVYEGGIYDTWYFTPVPYFFPDILLYFIVHSISGDFYHALSLFFLVEAFFFVWILYLIFSYFFTKRTAWYVTVFVFSGIYFFKTPVWLLQFLSGFHYGGFLVGLWMLYLLLFQMKSRTFRISLRTVVLFVVWVAVIASDRLYVLQWILPMIGALVLMWAAGLVSWKHMLGMNLSGVAAVIVGKRLHDALIPNRLIHADANDPALSLEQIPYNLERLQSIFFDFMQHYSVAFFVMITVILLSVVTIVRYKKIVRMKKGKAVVFIALTFLLMAIGSILAFSMTTREINARYFIPLFVLPWVYLPLFTYYTGLVSSIRELLGETAKSRLLFSGIVMVCVSLLWSARESFLHQKWYNGYTTPWIECVDCIIKEVNATKIAAQYWQSKNLYVLSEHNISVAQYDRMLNPYKWITTTRWYKKKYDLVLIDHGASQRYYELNYDLIEEKNGKPDKVWRCGETEIWFYKEGATL